MGRFLSHPARAYSPNVQTLLYRAPEVLFNEPLYHCEIDVFSVGVIIAEMVKGIPMFAKCAKNEIELVRAWQSYFLLIIAKLVLFHLDCSRMLRD